MEFIERSSEVEEKLMAVKSMPETPVPQGEQRRKESSEKQKAAELLRMELLLDTATLTADLIDLLQMDPTADVERLNFYARDCGHIVHPRAVAKFISGIVKTKDSVAGTLGIVKAETHTPAHASTAFYKGTLTQEKRALVDGDDLTKVKFGPEYPLAISLELSEDNFDLIDTRSVGGLYGAVTNVDVRTPRWRPVLKGQLPVIFINGIGRFGSGTVRGHEEGHADNKEIITALSTKSVVKIPQNPQAVTGQSEPKSDTKEVILYHPWGANADIETSVVALETSKGSRVPKQGYREMAPYRALINTAFAQAKNELLAEMKPLTGSAKQHVDNLLTRLDLYDYFKYATVGSDLYDVLWAGYKLELRRRVRLALDLDDNYRHDTLFTKRAEIYRFVLAQIPLEDWDEQLKKTRFEEEWKRYQDANVKFGNLAMALRKRNPNEVLSSEEQQLLDDAMNLESAMRTDIEEHCDKPLIILLDRYHLELDEIRKRYEGSEKAHFNEAHRRMTSTHMRLFTDANFAGNTTIFSQADQLKNEYFALLATTNDKTVLANEYNAKMQELLAAK